MSWVMVMDDDRLVATHLLASLAGRGIRALHASDGAEALTLMRAAESPPAVVIAEIAVQDGSGLSFLASVAADPQLRRCAPIVFTRSQNPHVPSRAAIVFRKATDGERLVSLIERLVHNATAGEAALSEQRKRGEGTEAEPGSASHPMRRLDFGALRVEVSSSPEAVDVALSGRSDSRDPGALLHLLFEELLAEAAGTQRPMVLHFERLEFFNSSTLAFVIQLVNRARGRAPIELIYAETLRWQSVSFEALRRALQMFEREETLPVRFTGVAPGGRQPRSVA